MAKLGFVELELPLKLTQQLLKTLAFNTVIKAVFSATKDELSPERIQEVAGFSPGEIWKRGEEA